MRHFLCLSVFLSAFLLGTACSIYHEALERGRAADLHAREEVLKIDLTVIRSGIKQYTSDTGALPHSLENLVKTGHLRQVDGATLLEGVPPAPSQDNAIGVWLWAPMNPNPGCQSELLTFTATQQTII
jgi:hypothetical protein